MSKPATVGNVVDIMLSTFNSPAEFIKDISLSRAHEWIVELIKTTKYVETLRKKFEDSMAGMVKLGSDMKEKNPKREH